VKAVKLCPQMESNEKLLKEQASAIIRLTAVDEEFTARKIVIALCTRGSILAYKMQHGFFVRRKSNIT